MRVLFLTNIPSPYRVEFFNELGKGCNLTVAFEGECATDRNVNWIGSSAEYFDAIYMRGKRISTDKFLCINIFF